MLFLNDDDLAILTAEFDEVVIEPLFQVCSLKRALFDTFRLEIGD